MEMRPRAADLGLYAHCAGLDLLAASTFVAVKPAPRGASDAVHVPLALYGGVSVGGSSAVCFVERSRTVRFWPRRRKKDIHCYVPAGSDGVNGLLVSGCVDG